VAELVEKATVLVVDDQPDNRLLIRRYLQALGCTLVEAVDGEDALIKVAELNPDLVVLDVEMPKKDGFEVCRSLKSWEETRNIPVLMVTALTAVESRIKAIESGADEFLSKPVDRTELQTRVKAMLKSKFYRQQLLEKNALLERILTRWHSREVVDRVLDDASLLKLGGTRSAVSVLFADLSGFTRFSESVPAEQVMDTLNQTFSRLTRIVEDNRGTFDKYIGDCLMAFYGAPISFGNDALNAVRSAAQMQEAFRELQTQWKGQPQGDLGLAIGINSGEAIVGNVGSEKLMEYTVIGDTVNVAARLQSKAERGQVLISESTQALVADVAVTKSWGETGLKGRAKPVPVFELVRVFKTA